MVAPAFPLAKLGFLAIKQISKPLANAVANRGRKSKFFRNFIVLPVAQLFHFLDVKVRMRILNLGKVTKVPKLDEKKAIDTGSQLLSEFVILSVGAGILLFEYRRQGEKEEVKQAEIEQEKRDLRDQVDRLAITMEKQSAQLNEMSRITIGLRDDLEAATKKNSGFLGFGKGTSEGKTPEIKEVSNEYSEECQLKPITSAVLKMNLHSV